MTDRNEAEAMDVREPFAVVEAFLDGECVDANALKAALAQAGGRDHLIDLLALRAAVVGMGPSRWSAVHRASPITRGFRWVAAAALVVCSLMAGYLAGTRTIRAAAAQPDVAAVVTLPEPSAAPPAPTKVITLRPGVNWTDVTGER